MRKKINWCNYWEHRDAYKVLYKIDYTAKKKAFFIEVHDN